MYKLILTRVHCSRLLHHSWRHAERLLQPGLQIACQLPSRHGNTCLATLLLCVDGHPGHRNWWLPGTVVVCCCLRVRLMEGSNSLADVRLPACPCCLCSCLPACLLQQVMTDNPLADFVELPDEYKPLCYSNLLPGVIRGALEMVRQAGHYKDCRSLRRSGSQ